MTNREVEASLRSGEITVTLKEDSDMLLQSGYGSRREGKSVVLSHCEALYLLGDRRVRVLEENKEAEIPFQSLLDKFRMEDPEIWIRYLIYADLRRRGYVVKEGFGEGIDFRMYERGTYRKKPAKYIVYAICEGNPIPASRLNRVLRKVQGMKRKLIVAVVDRRGEIVYYSLSWLNLSLRLKATD